MEKNVLNGRMDMNVVKRTEFYLLLIVTAGIYIVIYYYCYSFSATRTATVKFPSLIIISKVTVKPETVTNSSIKHQLAIEMSKEIIEHENGLIKAGLLPKYENLQQWYKPNGTVDYGDGTCPKNKNRELYIELMQKWKQLSQTYSIPYFLYAGSLIGAARDSDVIPWDGDMDILVDGRFNDVIAALADVRNFSGYDPEFHLIIQRDFKKVHPKKMGRLYPTDHRRRFNCRGKEVKNQTDHCSFKEPLARLIKNSRHMDLYDYHYKDDIIYEPAHNGHKYGMDLVFPLRRCIYMGIEMICPQQIVPFLQSLYNNANITIPAYMCSNKTWIKTPKIKAKAG